MKKAFLFMVLCLVLTPGFADDARGRAAQARVSTLAQLQSSKKQTPNMQIADSAIPMDPEKTGPSIVDQNNAVPAPQVDRKDMREKERAACLNNNIGIGNTFVWASRYSNTSNYAYMVEDMEEPENNVCFVKVDMRSDDSRISLSDVPSKYFQWGQNITCGSWTNEDNLRQRILDAKKTGRTWGTVAGAVGGAGIGVGAMELFGNKLIDGKVQGQQNTRLSDVDKLQAHLSNLKKENPGEYEKLIAKMKQLDSACKGLQDNKPDVCSGMYIEVLSRLNG